MRVVMAKGLSQYGGTRFFVDHAAAAFRGIGARVEVLDLAAVDDIPAALAAAAATPADLVFTINYLGDYRDARGRSIGEMFRGPHVIWHTDYILAYEQRLLATAQDAAVLVVDPTQAEAVRDILGPDRFARLAFFPHPAVGAPSPPEADAEVFQRGRPIPLLWCGSLQRPGERPWADAPDAVRGVFESAVDLALSVEWMAPHEALDAVLRAIGLDLADPGLVGVRLGARLVDMEVRIRRRWTFVQALAATGLPLHICGAGWETELHRFPAAVHEGAVGMERAVDLMRRARVVLNTNGNFGAGSHERPFSALLAGAAVFSDCSRYYSEAFAPDEIVQFRWTALAEGMDALTRLATVPEAAYAVAAKGRARVAAEHTWERRLPLILEAARRAPWD